MAGKKQTCIIKTQYGSFSCFLSQRKIGTASPILPAVLLEYLDSGCHSHGNYGNPYMSYPLLSWAPFQ